MPGAPRFHLPCALQAGVRVELAPGMAHHARNVLRLHEGDPIVLFNGQGGEFRARLALDPGARDRGAHAQITGFDPIERETALRLTLIQALATSDKIDWIIEKATEVGVARIIVTPASRSTARLDEARGARRLQHWHERSLAACCQCGRNRAPAIELAPSLLQALQSAGDGARRILDPDAPRALIEAPQARLDLTLAVGPEGGFSPDEMVLAGQAGFVRARLGPRILRTETAGLVAAAAWLAACGEFSEGPG